MKNEGEATSGGEHPPLGPAYVVTGLAIFISVVLVLNAWILLGWPPLDEVRSIGPEAWLGFVGSIMSVFIGGGFAAWVLGRQLSTQNDQILDQNRQHYESIDTQRKQQEIEAWSQATQLLQEHFVDDSENTFRVTDRTVTRQIALALDRWIVHCGLNDRWEIGFPGAINSVVQEMNRARKYDRNEKVLALEYNRARAQLAYWRHSFHSYVELNPEERREEALRLARGLENAARRLGKATDKQEFPDGRPGPTIPRPLD